MEVGKFPYGTVSQGIERMRRPSKVQTALLVSVDPPIQNIVLAPIAAKQSIEDNPFGVACRPCSAKAIRPATSLHPTKASLQGLDTGDFDHHSLPCSGAVFTVAPEAFPD